MAIQHVVRQILSVRKVPAGGTLTPTPSPYPTLTPNSNPYP